jgi:hypothetical protein
LVAIKYKFIAIRMPAYIQNTLTSEIDNVNFALQQAMKALRGRRGMDLLFL